MDPAGITVVPKVCSTSFCLEFRADRKKHGQIPPKMDVAEHESAPRVIVSVRKPSRLLSAAAARRLRPSAKTVSQALLVDGGSPSTSDTDGESVNTNEADMTDELAMDELIVDHVRPTLPQTITKPNKSEEID
jgi:hypothetical protein